MNKIALIGCGVRADAYLNQLKNDFSNGLKLVALADPNPTAIEEYRRLYCSSDVMTFTSGPELLKKVGDQLDGVIIASPNVFHLESLIPAINKKLVILLEKPVAITIDECKSMWSAYQSSQNSRIAVGFVLRYTAFYRKIIDIIEKGEIGKVLSIAATESIVPSISSHFNRWWRRFEKYAGPFLVEKCCHDMDVMNMIAGSKAAKVSSFASRTRFVENKQASMHCKDCSLKEDCRYEVTKMKELLVNCAPSKNIVGMQITGDDLCVFNAEKDTPDHQIVNIEYENGILASFSVSLDQPTPARTIKIFGTEGQIDGNIEEDCIKLYTHGDKITDTFYYVPETKTYDINHDATGHHGGDSMISDSYKRMLYDKSSLPLAGLREGIDACLIALAAEISRKEERIVNMEELYKKVYDL